MPSSSVLAWLARAPTVCAVPVLPEIERALVQRHWPAFHRRILLEPPGRPLPDGPDQPRPVEHPSVGDGPDRDGHLERCDGDVALPNGGGDGLAGVPLLFPHKLLPFGGGYDPDALRRQMDAGGLPQAEQARGLGDRVDAEAMADVV